MECPRLLARTFAIGLVTLAGSGLAELGAQVATIDVQPASLPNLPAGEQREVLALARDARGQDIFDATFRWTTSDPAVVRVEADATVPGLAIVTGIAAGVATIEVRAGNVTKAIAVNVVGQAQPTPVQPQARPELPDTVMAPGVADRAANLAARVRAFPFQTAPLCGSGFFVTGDGLLLTTYRAIRGADRLEIELEGQTVSNVQVAAYSTANDLAVLRLPGVSKADSLTPASGVVEETVVWAFGYPDCGSLTRTRLRVQGEQRVEGRSIVRLSDALTTAERGAPLLTQQGQVMAVAAGDATAVPAPQVADLLAQARTNVRLRALLSAQDVGRRENHLFGSLAISSGVAGTAARIRPLESWHWPELATEGATPFTFTGPAGRYRIELLQDGQVRSTSEAVVRAGEVDPVALQLPVAAGPPPAQQPPPQVAAGGGGGFPVALVVLGLAGAGAGAYFLLAGGDGGCPEGTTGTPPNCTPISNGNGEPGSITISVPNP